MTPGNQSRSPSSPPSSACRPGNCYVLDPQARMAQANGLVVLTVDSERIRAITHFPDNSLLSWFGLPRSLP